jgi:hypothetical protein
MCVGLPQPTDAGAGAGAQHPECMCVGLPQPTDAACCLAGAGLSQGNARQHAPLRGGVGGGAPSWACQSCAARSRPPRWSPRRRADPSCHPCRPGEGAAPPRGVSSALPKGRACARLRPPCSQGQAVRSCGQRRARARHRPSCCQPPLRRRAGAGAASDMVCGVPKDSGGHAENQCEVTADGGKKRGAPRTCLMLPGATPQA